jgi:hypothetical protein
MSMVFCKKTRRQFLVGTGKTLLALPFLPSLMPSTAQAQAAMAQRKMMLFWFDHNNMLEMWPLLNRAAATTPVGNSGAKEVLLRSLGSAPAISLAFRHPIYQTLMNSDLVSVLRGFDLAQWDGTHGNYTMAAGAGRNSEGGHPTIDTIIEASPNVYPLMTTPSNVSKAIRVDMLGIPGFYQRIGTGVQQVTAFQRWEVSSAYNQVFSGLTAGTTTTADNTNRLKTNILNRVYDSYVSFKGSRKISADDRFRLDQHMSFISQIQAGYSQGNQTVNACVRPTTPPIGTDPALSHKLYFQLLAIAFQCNLTKFGTMYFELDDPQWMPGAPALGTGFHNACHGGAGADIQKRAFEIFWPYLTDNIAEYFLKPLNTEEGSTGRTYIQNMVTGFITSAGTFKNGTGDGGHSGYDSQQILLGNMAGALRSGRYMAMPETGYDRLPYNCFLLTLLQLMGVPPSEYQFTSSTGQGIGNYTGFPATHPYRSRFYSPITEILT